MTRKSIIHRGFKLAAFCFLFFAFSYSCEKNAGPAIYKVWYLLELPTTFDANITYYSDKYVATKNLETLHINDTNYTPLQATFSETSNKLNVWVANHLQSDRSLPYYIEAQFNSATKFDYTNGKKYVMMVFVNDTTMIDSIQFLPTYNKLKLTGNIPTSF